MTITGGQAAAYALVMALGALSPGPDFAIVVRRAAVSGRARGMATAAGIAAGVFVWAVAAATGVAALLAASAVAFTVVKVVGAAYLARLGIRALVAAPAAAVGRWTSRMAGMTPRYRRPSGRGCCATCSTRRRRCSSWR